ncbi:hypothetical protein EDD86DRAFT_198105, partial [Gorgonomyces haynaldii]
MFFWRSCSSVSSFFCLDLRALSRFYRQTSSLESLDVNFFHGVKIGSPMTYNRMTRCDSSLRSAKWEKSGIPDSTASHSPATRNV